jgi:predicted nucleic acid-binding protein
LSHPPLAYIDTNVFLSYIAGPLSHPVQYPLAKEFFNEIASHKWIGVISYLTLLEILDVLRKWRASELEAISKIQTDWDRTRYVIEGAKQVYSNIIAETLATPDFRIIETPNVDANLLMTAAFEILTDITGVVRLYNSCSKCGYEQDHPIISVHKSVGAADILHALIAKEAKCHKLVTFDKGFLDLINNPRLQPLWIHVLRPPKHE